MTASDRTGFKAAPQEADIDTVSRWDVIEIMISEIERVRAINPELPNSKRKVTLTAVEHEYEAIMDIFLSLPPSKDGMVEGAPSPAEIDKMARDARGKTRGVLSRWGVEWPPKKGWRAALIERIGGKND